MSYACDDIDQTYKELTKRGVEFEGPPQKQPWGTYAMFKDSEGNRFVVSQERAVNDSLTRNAAAKRGEIFRVRNCRIFCATILLAETDSFAI